MRQVLWSSRWRGGRGCGWWYSWGPTMLSSNNLDIPEDTLGECREQNCIAMLLLGIVGVWSPLAPDGRLVCFKKNNSASPCHGGRGT